MKLQEGKYVQGNLVTEDTRGDQGGCGKGQGLETKSFSGWERGIRERGGEQTFSACFVLISRIALWCTVLLLFAVMISSISYCLYLRIDLTPSLLTVVI